MTSARRHTHMSGRHQRLRPVCVHAGSSAYRVRRFAQRNKLGAGGITWQSRQAAIERDIAGRAAPVRSGFNAISYLFRSATETGQIGSVTAREMLDANARKLIATSDPDDPDSLCGGAVGGGPARSGDWRPHRHSPRYTNA